MHGLHLHLDLPSGIAGDMTLGALFDLGVPVEVVREALARLPLAGWELQVQKVVKRGMAGTDAIAPSPDAAPDPITPHPSLHII